MEEPPEVHTARINPRSTQEKNEPPEVQVIPRSTKKNAKNPPEVQLSLPKKSGDMAQFEKMYDLLQSKLIKLQENVNDRQLVNELNELYRNSKPYIKSIRRLGLSTVSNAPFLKRAFMKYAMGI